jgi:hypothetical protein
MVHGPQDGIQLSPSVIFYRTLCAIVATLPLFVHNVPVAVALLRCCNRFRICFDSCGLTPRFSAEALPARRSIVLNEIVAVPLLSDVLYNDAPTRATSWLVFTC